MTSQSTLFIDDAEFAEESRCLGEHVLVVWGDYHVGDVSRLAVRLQ